MACDCEPGYCQFGFGPKEHCAIQNPVLLFRDLTPDQRVELIDTIGKEYCLYCGDQQPRTGRECQCWNDD